MDAQHVVKKLREEYPKGIIKLLPENNPSEIICEITNTPEKSYTIAVIEKSIPHFHKEATETYTVISGSVTVHLGDQTIRLREGERCEIQPGIIHWAEGKEVWIACVATPGWRPEDHIIVIK